MATRTVSWGDALLVAAVKAPGGLNQTVTRIQGVVGPQIGTRNSFSKLYRVEDPIDMNPRDKWRTWLLLTAVGENPTEWGIGDDVVPAIHADRLDTLRRLLKYTPRDSNPEPTDYGRVVALRPPKRRDNTRPRGRAA